MTENTSPEERLFKIIQKEKHSSPRASIAIWKEKLKAAISAAKNIISKPGTVFSGRSLPEPELRTVNTALSAVLSILMISAVYYTVARHPKISRMISAAVRAESALPSVSADITELKPIDYYTGDAGRRNIFSAAQRPAAGTKETPVQEEKKVSGSELSLQGIAWSDVPKAMIQAGKESRLYILKEGQAVGTTGIKIKKILRNKVVLIQGEKEFEL